MYVVVAAKVALARSGLHFFLPPISQSFKLISKLIGQLASG